MIQWFVQFFEVYVSFILVTSIQWHREKLVIGKLGLKEGLGD